MRKPCVYLLASKRNGTLYVGVTSDLVRRLWEHKTGNFPGFTKDYGVKFLMHFEVFETMDQAIAREKAIKKWHRDWKIQLIEKENPGWRDLAEDLLGNCED